MNKSAIQISGRVIHGDNYGKKLGFPTANLDRRQFVRIKQKVRLGVWAGFVTISPQNVAQAFGLQKKAGQRPALQKEWLAGIVIGPLDKHGLPKVEAHLIGFKGNLYGKKITIILKKYMRPFKKFKNGQELKNQIQADLKKINKLLL